MFPPRVPAVLALVLSLLTGCHLSPSSGGTATGSVQVSIQMPEAPLEDVSRITVTASGPDMDSLSMDLAFSEGVWSGVLRDVPPGPHRTFLAQGFTTSTHPRYEGRAEDVTVTGHSADLVTVGLQELFSDAWPTITSGSQSSLKATAGQTLDFEVEATNPSDSALTFSWTATSGTFGAATSSTTHSRVPWTASDQCVIEGQTQRIGVIAADGLGHRSSWEFKVKGLPTCPTGGWTLTGPMSTYHYLHASAPLPDGKVLVVGGAMSIMGMTAEVYEPVNNTWRPTGSMATARQWHTATALPDGRVLVAGGEAGLSSLSTAEVYDPATGTWSPTGSMATGRQRHTATLLRDGRVLVVGTQYIPNDSPMPTEVYDPATGTWRSTGSISKPRYGHTATLLGDGRVLIAGGSGEYPSSDHSDHSVARSAEVYDPATGIWSPTGSMASPRESHTATLLPDGRVLVAGGWALAGSGLDPATAEVYDPATGTWSPTNSMSSPRSGHTAILLPTGKVLVVGGAEDKSYDALGDYHARARAEVYDPATSTWHPISSMSVPSYARFTAHLLPSSKVLFVGNVTEDLQVEVYDPAAEP